MCGVSPFTLPVCRPTGPANVWHICAPPQAKTVVAPLDRVKILFQASNPEFQKYAGASCALLLFFRPVILTPHLSGTWSGAYRAGTQIYKDSGVLGLFQGHSATLLRIFPYSAVKFMAYDQVHDVRLPSSLSDPFARSSTRFCRC